MDLSVEELAIHLAPLPRPMINHLLHLLPAQELEGLKWQASLQRSNVFDRFHSPIMLEREKAQDITVNWLLGELSAVLQKKFARSTLFNWHQRGFIRHVGRGRPKAEDVARLLFYYALIGAYHLEVPERDILPATLVEQNSWCWQQAHPDAPITPFMLPEEEEIPSLLLEEQPSPEAIALRREHDLSLYWTPWAGAAWDKSRWLQVGGLGAITCGYLLFHPPATFDYLCFLALAERWKPQLRMTLPYFRDVSHHGDKLHRYELPAHKLTELLWDMAQTRLDGPTFYFP